MIPGEGPQMLLKDRFDLSGEVVAVVFLRDPLTAQPHEPDVSAFLRLCDVHCIPLATNVTSARILLTSLDTSLDLFQS